MNKWVEIKYKDGWYPNGNTCVLTNAEADGRWQGQKYAIFGFEDGWLHVAFWPTKPIVISSRELGKEEAYDLVCESINGRTLMDDLNKTYG